MDKENIKKNFLDELNFFHLIALRDLNKGFTLEQVEDELARFTTSFYGARLDFDDYATIKCSFILTYLYQIIKGNISDEYLEEFYSDVENKMKNK